MDLIQQVKKTILQQQLFRRGETILVGVSGGPDSVALLYILCQLRHELGFKILVAHINHQLRRSAETDQRFVERLGNSLHLPTFVRRVTIRKSRIQSSLEELSREKRLAVLVRLAQQKRADCIALAHHQDDLAETVLMRILRGTGLMGLQAILPQREILGMRIVRPLLETPRTEIMKFLKLNKISFRTDPTNRHTRFFRNKIRLQLLPLLEEKYQNNIKNNLANLSASVAEGYAYLHQQAQKIFLKIGKNISGNRQLSISVSVLTKMHPSLQRMVMRLAIARLRGDMKRLTLQHIREIEDMLKNRPLGSIVHLPSGLEVRMRKNNLMFRRKA